MKKRVFGRKLKRDGNERKALFKGLMTSLVIHESIQTTEEKAKSIKPFVEKLVTKAKKDKGNAMSLLMPYLNADAAKKMLTDVAPRFTDRNGGYTRIVKLGRRFNDNASMVVIEWVEKGAIGVGRRAEGKEGAKKITATTGKPVQSTVEVKEKAPKGKSEKSVAKGKVEKASVKAKPAKKGKTK